MEDEKGEAMAEAVCGLSARAVPGDRRRRKWDEEVDLMKEV